NKIALFNAVKGAMLTVLMMFAIEGINVAFLQVLFKDDLITIISDPYKKTLAGIPGLILFGVIVITLYYFLAYRYSKNKTEEKNGETS
ncbi:MAG: hypothetical protein PHV88_07590, partial [Eubacteriales bacterium]|nr:hypothetical protein [Eubacteriales bacterium]